MTDRIGEKMEGSPINWNEYRTNYSCMSFSEIGEFYHTLDRHFPDQEKLNVDNFVTLFDITDGPHKVIELGCHNGSRSRKVVKRVESIDSWTGYDFDMFDGTSNGRYKFKPLTDWFHNTELPEFNTFVSSHTLEHLSNEQALETLRNISGKAKYIFLQLPLTEHGEDWHNRWNAHIMTWGMDKLRSVLIELGYKLFYENNGTTGWESL